MTDSSYFFVERLVGGDTWAAVATDANWETSFVWTRTSSILGRSKIDFFWSIPDTAPQGEYRIRHTGFYKYIMGGVYPYQGSTEHFSVA